MQWKKTMPQFKFWTISTFVSKQLYYSESPMANLFRYFIPREVAIYPFQFKSLSFKDKNDFCVDRKLENLNVSCPSCSPP